MLLVGTSGWQYKHWRGRFYPEGFASTRWLTHYAQRFATVEVNNTFYRLPAASTFESWAARTPDDFCFALKASRYLTHYSRLREPEAPVALFLDRARPLGARLGPVLVQLPPDMRCEPQRLDDTLRAFASMTRAPARSPVRVAVEFRHDSWFCEEIRAILTSHDAALCLADRSSKPITPLWRTASWTYLRFHHGTATPVPCYGYRTLAIGWTGCATSWARRLTATSSSTTIPRVARCATRWCSPGWPSGPASR